MKQETVDKVETLRDEKLKWQEGLKRIHQTEIDIKKILKYISNPNQLLYWDLKCHTGSVCGFMRAFWLENDEAIELIALLKQIREKKLRDIETQIEELRG